MRTQRNKLWKESHIDIQHSIFNVHYSVPSNESHEWQHFNTQTPRTTNTNANNKNTSTSMCSPNWEIEYRKKQFETRCAHLRVDVYFLQYASTATVLSRNRLIFKLFQISELKRYMRTEWFKAIEHRQCKIYMIESSRFEFEQ